jgi:hypothetical protein
LPFAYRRGILMIVIMIVKLIMTSIMNAVKRNDSR